MQTFLPYENYARSSEVLDSLRLRKQAVECLQIAAALLDPSQPYFRHPATLMWTGAEVEFARYTIAVAEELECREFVRSAAVARRAARLALSGRPGNERPWWEGLPMFHDGMRGNLVRKDRIWYAPLLPASPRLDYQWPVRSIQKVLHYHPDLVSRPVPAGAPLVPVAKVQLYRMNDTDRAVVG